jgi:Flp pilus assembly protein TadG
MYDRPSRRAQNPRRNLSHDRGQSTVELALSLPIILMLLLAVVQVAIVVAEVLSTQVAAREGARAASMAASPHSAAAAAVARSWPAAVNTSVQGGIVRVTVQRTIRTDVPMVGWLLPDVRSRATVVMQREPP